MDVYEALSSAPAGVPRSRFVFMTGGSFTERARTFLQAVPFPRIDKPFEPGLLLALVDSSPPRPGSSSGTPRAKAGQAGP